MFLQEKNMYCLYYNKKVKIFYEKQRLNIYSICATTVDFVTLWSHGVRVTAKKIAFTLNDVLRTTYAALSCGKYFA